MSKFKYTTRMGWLDATIERFWTNVDRSSNCWLWTGTVGSSTKESPLAYGNFGVTDYRKNLSFRAHRFSWLLCNGPIPEGKILMHTCDVPLCVNPSHLRLGEPRENSQDMIDKGRSKTGEAHWNSKFTNGDIKWIRESSWTESQIAKKYNASPSNIHRIKTGKSWKHLPMPGHDSVLQHQTTHD